MTDYPRRGDIYWIKLDPTMGTETQKTRPCIILSNNSQNKKGLRVIAAPVTSKVKTVYPFEAVVIVQGRECKALMDQIRALDKNRISSKIDSIDSSAMFRVEEALKVAVALKKD
ncbi:MAG: type II toxin-antitoxin system PemK/MazF family toxin [Parachlamydiaceae bacterium]|nr:type II toxin-antitoxin system PemK/MazF family toxin [Parachlamydiaceae bacterium]